MPEKHGYAHRGKKDSLYNRWIMMRNRCYNESAEDYEYYGGRGIKICAEWDDYENFRNWAMANGYNRKLQIDRIDTDGDYEPTNCRWVSQYINEQNRRKFKNNQTGMTGVCYVPQKEKYTTYINRFDKRIFLGDYKTLDEAYAARRAAESVLKHIEKEDTQKEEDVKAWNTS